MLWYIVIWGEFVVSKRKEKFCTWYFRCEYFIYVVTPGGNLDNSTYGLYLKPGRYKCG